MYHGEVNVEQEHLSSFLHTAEMLAVQGLSVCSAPKEEVCFFLFCYDLKLILCRSKEKDSQFFSNRRLLVKKRSRIMLKLWPGR